MEDYILLFVLSLAMFIGSYVAGSLPLIVSFTESKLRLVTVIGAGLLVGTALAVIIPEGVQSIYAAQSKTEKLALEEFIMTNNLNNNNNNKHGERSIIMDEDKLNSYIKVKDHNNMNNNAAHHIPALNASPSNNSKTAKRVVVNQSKPTPPIGGGDVNVVQSEQKLADVPNKRLKKRHVIQGGDKNNADQDGSINNDDVIDAKAAAANLHNSRNNGGHEHAAHMQDLDNSKPLHPHVHGGGVDVHNAVGLALVAGFVLMLLIDQLAQSRNSRIDSQSGIMIQPRYKITATIGLVVHAAADGVALGAASGSSHTDVQFIVFFAIMLHKAPASFGLVTFLLHEGLDKSRIRKHLLIFALSAPLAALATFFCITKGGPESLTSLHSTGVLLLFSAGTFLYVATVHVLPEVAGSGGGGHSHGGSPISSGQGGGGFKFNELIALVIGAIAPTLLTVGHSH